MQRLTSSALFKALLVLITLAAIWVLAAYLQYRHERNLAQAAIRTVGQIQVGHSTRSQADVMLTPYAKFRVHGPENAIELAFVNRRWLEPFRSPTQWIYITVEFTDGIASSRSFQFLEQPRRRASLTQHIRLPAPVLRLGEAISHRRIRSNGDPASPYFVTDIREDLEVPEEQRARDWQFDLDCFKFLRSCKNPNTVLAAAQPQ
jgi:hypothetical protein